MTGDKSGASVGISDGDSLAARVEPPLIGKHDIVVSLFENAAMVMR